MFFNVNLRASWVNNEYQSQVFLFVKWMTMTTINMYSYKEFSSKKILVNDISLFCWKMMRNYNLDILISIIFMLRSKYTWQCFYCLTYNLIVLLRSTVLLRVFIYLLWLHEIFSLSKNSDFTFQTTVLFENRDTCMLVKFSFTRWNADIHMQN